MSELTYTPDKRQPFERAAPAGNNFYCRFCSKWIKADEFEVHKKEHQPKIKIVPVETP
uniref:Uncharacterized protein n=1 Tax=viral metagenome TaxID=1070528 RepID=A0A6M3LB21_9ZZZZ